MKIRGIFPAVARVFLVCAAVFILAAVCFIRPPDESQLSAERALARSRRELEKAAAGILTPEKHPLEAGWAKREITPSGPVPLAGYGARRGELSHGAATSLWCRALALRSGETTLVFVSLEVLIIPRKLSDVLRESFHERTGLPRESLFLFPTHTHSAPNPSESRLKGLIAGGRHCGGWTEFLKDSVLDASEEAVSLLGAAEIVSGRLRVPELIRNRTREKPVDPFLEWLAVRSLKTGKICVVANYAAHATVLGSGNMLVDGDYPGYFSRRMESLEDVGLALFQAGGMGSAGPSPPPGTSRPERAEKMGSALAGRLSEALSDGLEWKSETGLSSFVADITLPPFQLRPSESFSIARWVPRVLGFPETAQMHAAIIGNTLVAGLPVELSAEISKDVKSGFADRKQQNLWISSMATGYYGYVSPDELYRARDAGGNLLYESGWMAFLGPHAEYYFRGLLEELSFEAAAGAGE